MINKKLLWITPSIILLLLIIFFIPLQYKKDICGDGICKEGELEFCDIDCSDDCIEPTGAIEDVEEQCSVGWEGVYLELLEDGWIKSQWLSETEQIDFSDSNIRKLAQELRKNTVKETAKAIAEWTYFNIRYNYDDNYADCKSTKASEILERKSGKCSTMSKLNIALLRANGIPAYSNTGCFKFNEACNRVQTFFAGRLPIFVPIYIDAEGYAPTSGNLHNWIVFPLYEEGEFEDVIMESTAGRIYENKCVNYRIYYEDPSDSLACGLIALDPNIKNCEDW